ncbi:MAG: hypothetical protein AABX28_01025 [Nanoarchaeota archaeon]
MTEKNQNSQQEKAGRLEVLARYEFGSLAATLFEPENPALANSALELLDEQLRLDKGTKAEVDFSRSKEGGLKKAVEIYSGLRNRARAECSVGELADYYNVVLGGYLQGEEYARVKGEITKYSGEKFGELSGKIQQARYVLDGAKKGLHEWKDEDLKSAQSTLEEYTNVITFIQALENAKLESLKPAAVKRANEKMFKGFAESLKQAAEQKKTA